MIFKIRSERHGRLAKNVPDGTASWGNPCECRGCRDDAVQFLLGHELCAAHFHCLLHEIQQAKKAVPL